MKLAKIYYLEHPEKNIPVYVGVAKGSLLARLKAHNEKMYGKDLCSKGALYFRKKGLKFRISQIDEVPLSEWSFWKQYWVDQFLAWGFRLANSSAGNRENK